MIGRKQQISTLNSLYASKKSEFLAVTGRRRIGKTYLVDTVYNEHLSFRVSGIQDGGLNVQIFNFLDKLSEKTKLKYPKTKTWQEAFLYLKQYCQTLNKKKKHVLFFDELPWMNTPKSNFIQFLAHFWNDYLSKENHFILVICGSASSWITKKIIKDKGGLHNRLTEIISLKPFSLSETKEYLFSKKINMSDQSITLIYMILGGVPYYLNLIKKGESTTTAIQRLCFDEDSILKHEYQNLYKALFYNSLDHEAIVEALSKTKGSYTREEILKASKVQAGGPYNRAMEDLILSGFVSEDINYGKKKKGAVYRLNDEYTIFYHKFIKTASKSTSGVWSQISASQSFKIWAGLAFEALCFKHIDKIKSALGIAGVYTEIYAYRYIGEAGSDGFQIDMVIDRKDDTINLCEMKYYSGPFSIDKAYANELLKRKQKFIEKANPTKQVLITFITNYEISTNNYSEEIVDSTVQLSDIVN